MEGTGAAKKEDKSRRESVTRVRGLAPLERGRKEEVTRTRGEIRAWYLGSGTRIKWWDNHEENGRTRIASDGTWLHGFVRFRSRGSRGIVGGAPSPPGRGGSTGVGGGDVNCD